MEHDLTRIYHQLGFRANWSVESLRDDGAGDGLIFAPRYQPRDEIERIERRIKSESLFDPQFFVPGTNRGSLVTYDFFPEQAAAGFDTAEYDGPAAATSAANCVAFQVTQGFERIVIPTRYLDVRAELYLEAQARQFVDPFLEACATQAVRAPIVLQLVLPDRIVRDAGESAALLDWVTGLDAVSGCYIIPHLTQREKQIDDPDFLIGMLEFIDAIRGNEMEALVGYLNSEALLLLAADPTGLATGAYENLRMFSTRAFEEDRGEPQRGPSARLFISPLLQWIDHRYLGALDRALGWRSRELDPSPYTPVMLDTEFNWNFQRPEIYKHYFAVFMPLLARLGGLPLRERRTAILERLEAASALFARLEGAGVRLDQNSGGSHLAPWITALNIFCDAR